MSIFLVLRVHRASWICGFLVFIRFGNFAAIVSSICPPPPLGKPVTWVYRCSKLSHSSEALFWVFLVNFFSLFHFGWFVLLCLKVYQSFVMSVPPCVLFISDFIVFISRKSASIDFISFKSLLRHVSFFTSFLTMQTMVIRAVVVPLSNLCAGAGSAAWFECLPLTGRVFLSL